jgi:hypothetical protein
MFHANEIYYLSCQEASLPSLGSVENLAVECFLGYPYRQENPQRIWKVTGRQGWNSVYSARRVL